MADRRGRDRAVVSLLPGTELYGNWRIRALFKHPDKDGARGPSYIPPRAFALALFDTLAPQTSPADRPTHDLIGAAQEAVGGIQNARIRTELQALLSTARADIDAGLKAAEQLFNDRMERASGWYKRTAQYVLWGIALGMAFGLNANAFNVGSSLWKDDALRAAVVVQAQAALDEQPADARTGGCPAGHIGSTDDDGAEICKPDPQALAAVAESLDDVEQLNLPLGWADSNRPRGLGEILGYVFGCLVTAAAVSLGAPFWFTALQRVANLRGTGGKPEERADGARAPRRTRPVEDGGGSDGKAATP